jgi:hypothetical protein
MRTCFFICILLALGIHNSNAQKRPRFSSQSFAGFTEGASGTSFQLQAVNGVRINNWFGGVGVGLDYYYQRTVPVFFSVNKYFSSKKFPVFFSGDIGVNNVWLRGGYDFSDPGSYQAGIYYGGGVGWKFGLKKNEQAFLLNLGYNFKQFTNTYETVSPCLVPPCPVNKTTYDYRLNRLSLRFGFMF